MRFAYTILAWLPRALMVLVAIGLLNFTLIRMAPGDPASVIAGETGASDARYIEDIRSSYGLDQPMWRQAATYLGNLATFDLGKAIECSATLSISYLSVYRPRFY